MTTKKKREIKHVYFTSSINSEREKFEILESSINFSHKEFAQDVKDQLLELGIETCELSKMTYIKTDRINRILRGATKPTEEEVKIIKRKLYLT